MLFPQNAADGEPHVELYDWAAFLVLVPTLVWPSIHVVGANLQTGRARISSPVTRIHVAAQRLVTQSGRVYDLVGTAGPIEDCLAILDEWLRTYHAVVVTNLTDKLFRSKGRFEIEVNVDKAAECLH